MGREEKMRVIVCGGRDFQDKEFCFRKLDEIISPLKDIEIVSGNAKGVDSFGEEYALKKGLKLSIFKADWKKYGRAAGPIRNREMYHYALEDKPMIIAFWDGLSKGTKNMIDVASKDGADIHIVNI
jgi:hypothetical protein